MNENNSWEVSGSQKEHEDSGKDNLHAKAEQFFDLSPDLFCIVDANGCLSEFNNAWCETLGFSRGELSSVLLTDLIHPDDVESTSRKYFGHLKGKEAFSFVNRVRTKDGSYKWLEWRGRGLHGNTGSLAVARDITLRKLIEEKLKEQQEIHQAITVSARDAIIILDHKGLITFWNDAATAMLGYEREYVMGKDLHAMMVPAHFHSMHLAAFPAFQETGKGAVVGRVRELSVIHRDGHEIPMELSLSAIRIKDEWCSVGIIRDITERKKAELELRALNLKLKDTNDTKDKLFSVISHDLRGPIGSFSLALEMLTGDRYLDESVRSRLVQEMKNSANSTFSMLENLLNWSRSQTHSITLMPKPLQLQALIRENISILQASAMAKSIDFKLSFGEELVAYGDKDTVNVVIRNLISNAIKFTPNQGTITIHVNGDGDFVQVVVQDTGVGMQKDIVENLFRANNYASTFGTNNEKGSGIGLMLCRDFVERNGGSIHAESGPGEGSRFIFTLPVSKS